MERGKAGIWSGGRHVFFQSFSDKEAEQMGTPYITETEKVGRPVDYSQSRAKSPAKFKSVFLLGQE